MADGSDPTLQQLASAVTVATEQNRVLISARLPYELLDALQPKAKAADLTRRSRRLRPTCAQLPTVAQVSTIVPSST